MPNRKCRTPQLHSSGRTAHHRTEAGRLLEIENAEAGKTQRTLLVCHQRVYHIRYNTKTKDHEPPLPSKEARSQLSNTTCLRRYCEFHVAGKRAPGRYHLNRTGGRPDRYGSAYECTRPDGEAGCSLVERNGGSTRQIGADDVHGCPYLAGGGTCFHKRLKAGVKAEQSPTAGRAT